MRSRCFCVANPAPHQALRRDTLIFQCKSNWFETANAATILRPFLGIEQALVARLKQADCVKEFALRLPGAAKQFLAARPCIGGTCRAWCERHASPSAPAAL